jgi:hypothetical protein
MRSGGSGQQAIVGFIERLSPRVVKSCEKELVEFIDGARYAREGKICLLPGQNHG